MRLREIVELELEEEQGADRPLCQTQDHIYSISTICEKFNDKGKHVYFAFLELKAAFDLVPRQVIWEALADINVPEAHHYHHWHRPKADVTPIQYQSFLVLLDPPNLSLYKTSFV
jgi:hypothetical protein